MDIQLTNTMGRRKEVFTPIVPGEVGIYSCGLTVYNYAHIGNLRAYVFADVLKRVFLLNGYQVRHVMNITDVGHLSDDADEGEDKMLKGAEREGKSPYDIAAYYTEHFLNDLRRMEVILPDEMPRATDHIGDMIALIKKLEERGYTYESEGNIYFDALKYPDYAKLAKLDLSAEHRQSRTGEDTAKRNYFDFALWLTNYKYEDHAMLWDSPWGKGFPGWHIECSAMASRFLGERFDIHTGGIDHIPVHHTNEIAQSECAAGGKWVNYWLHSDWLVTGAEEKMSKSKDNFLRLCTLKEEGFSAGDYRYYLLSAHYRKVLKFSFKALAAAKAGHDRLRRRVAEFIEVQGPPVREPYEERRREFLAAVNDDLNTAKALALLFDVVGENDLDDPTKGALVREFDQVLGLRLADAAAEGDTTAIPPEVEALRAERDEARKQKDWARSDELRDQLRDLGYEVTDTPDGSVVNPIS